MSTGLGAPVIIGSAMTTCFGDRAETLAAISAGRIGARALSGVDIDKVRVRNGYPIGDGPGDGTCSAGWLSDAIHAAVVEAGLDPGTLACPVIVGSGLRALRRWEQDHLAGRSTSSADLHFGPPVRAALPQATQVLTLSNACSAGGSAIATAVDLIAVGDAEVVVVAAADTMTDSMLAMIGKVGDTPTRRIQPFQRDRGGVLLGEGAAAMVITRSDLVPAGVTVAATIRGVGMTCDAVHETAPDPDGIVAAVSDAHRRADVRPADIDLVLAHGTGTTLNDPTEAAVLHRVFGRAQPPVTAIKGAIGHTSGGAALMSLLVAVDALQRGSVPAIVGLTDPIDEAADLDLVIGTPRAIEGRIAQINAFGFGGVNAVTIVEVA